MVNARCVPEVFIYRCSMWLLWVTQQIPVGNLVRHSLQHVSIHIGNYKLGYQFEEAITSEQRQVCPWDRQHSKHQLLKFVPDAVVNCFLAEWRCSNKRTRQCGSASQSCGGHGGTHRKGVLCLWFETSRSATDVQRKFRTKFRKNPPSRLGIRRWHEKFAENECVVHRAKGQGRSRASNDDVERVCEAFIRSPRKSTYRASRELHMP
jgi:hypothetical protein